LKHSLREEKKLEKLENVEKQRQKEELERLSNGDDGMWILQIFAGINPVQEQPT